MVMMGRIDVLFLTTNKTFLYKYISNVVVRSAKHKPKTSKRVLKNYFSNGHSDKGGLDIQYNNSTLYMNVNIVAIYIVSVLCSIYSPDSPRRVSLAHECDNRE